MQKRQKKTEGNMVLFVYFGVYGKNATAEFSVKWSTQITDAEGLIPGIVF